MFEIKNDNYSEVPKITVIGVGGGGNNALDRMINSNLLGVNYIAVNTDVHVLGACKANVKIQIGKKITKGYGAGADSEVGEMSALESEDEIRAPSWNPMLSITLEIRSEPNKRIKSSSSETKNTEEPGSP